jgi:hypothetical protein
MLQPVIPRIKSTITAAMIHITRISDVSVFRSSWSVIDFSFFSNAATAKAPNFPRLLSVSWPSPFRLEPAVPADQRVANGTQRFLLLGLGPAENDILRWIPYTRLTEQDHALLGSEFRRRLCHS